MASDNIKAAIEALLFSSDKPLTLEQMRKALDNLDSAQIKSALTELQAEYEQNNRGIRLLEIAGGFQMICSPGFASFIRKLYKTPGQGEKISQPSLETLAIIAYKQPVTKLEIEALRKVNVDGVVSSLLEKNMIRIAGRKKAPGRPKLYATTREFLEHFGLKSLDDLPKTKDLTDPAINQATDVNTPANNALPKALEKDVQNGITQTSQ
ncbi:MAG: SMC-Scp complex subunit ScpB [Candidatus Omnitrophota bacterium]